MANMAIPNRMMRKKAKLGQTLGKLALYLVVAAVSLLTIFPI